MENLEIQTTENEILQAMINVIKTIRKGKYLFIHEGIRIEKPEFDETIQIEVEPSYYKNSIELQFTQIFGTPKK